MWPIIHAAGRNLDATVVGLHIVVFATILSSVDWTLLSFNFVKFIDFMLLSRSVDLIKVLSSINNFNFSVSQKHFNWLVVLHQSACYVLADFSLNKLFMFMYIFHKFYSYIPF